MPEPRVTDRSASRWITRLFHRWGKASALVALALPLIGGGLVVLQAHTLADILHRAIIEHAPLSALTTTLLTLAALLGLRALLGAAGEFASLRASETIKARLRVAVFGALLQRGPVWSRGQSSGAMGTLMLEQIEAMDGFFTRYMPAMIQAGLLPLAFAAIAFPIDWMVGLLFLVTAPLIPVFMALAGWGAEAATQSQATALSRLTGRFADRLRGMVTLKLFGRAEAETLEIHARSEELRERTMKVMRIAFLSSAVLEFFAALGVAGVALYVGLTFLDLVTLRGTELTLRAGLFCLLLAPEVYQPLRLLAANYHDRAFAKTAAAEIAAVLGTLPATHSEAAPAAPVAFLAIVREPAPALVLRDLAVATPDGHPLLTGAELTVPAGSHIAILGASGIGKSTLLETIARLRPFTGSIEFGGMALDSLPDPLLRTRVGMLGQRPRLFAGSIADNIRLGRRGACDTAVKLAAERALVTAFTDDLPDRLDTPVGENGLGLSGGEIQRVALARLNLRQPGLVLLDEPTAHLDADTEAAVLESLLDWARGRTLLVATHSLAVAARMDRVYRLAGGKLLPTPAATLPRPALRKGAA